ncbi:uncharacterized protein BP01DRAFT_107745 [Aspergillus saccharolyticus JOP 1030-1]|uniref:Uncharacterized protein n=1 Tax=Aspergillus saccharolyticus JOP 1030-1 TaxID=1450539 RepID=A0A318ZT97_9EURO|nr:hypothetical protein BP01DRAFT_107745 [Aspergillus saccharolyticus JOP 1030-1]PYH43288.1 hypothetical protein BP01DRAFT_107745 [Aspergillus saccharolyticus JOP 1030-1]
MASVAQSDLEVDSHTSDMASQDSPLRRQFSEPLNAHSTSTQASPSPSPVTQWTKCTLCGKLIEYNKGSDSQNNVMKDHIATAHPYLTAPKMHRLASGGGDDDQSQLDDEEQGDDESVDEHAEVDASDLQEAEDDDDNHVNNALENGVADSTEVDDETYKLPEDADGEEPEADAPEIDGLSSQLHEFSRAQDPVTLDQRLHNLWNVHDIHKFCTDHDEKTANLEQSWSTLVKESKRPKKREAHEELRDRPEPYKVSKVAPGEFLEITPLEDFLSQLRDPEHRSYEELYAITENVAFALKAWQDEYLAIEKLNKHATRHNAKPTSDPRKLLRPQVFEDKKESMLYGYKYEPKEDKVGWQNPFTQGGFKPTPAQYRKMTAKLGLNHPNPDGWPTIMKFGVEHVPKFQNPPREDFVGKATRKRKAAELEAANREKASSVSDEAATDSPAPAETEDYPRQRRTRARRQGTDVEDQSDSASAPPIRFATRGRGSGRGRGRGGIRTMGINGSSESSQAPAPVAPPRSSTIRIEKPTAAIMQVRPGTVQLAPIEPAPSANQPAAPPAGTSMGGTPEDSIDPAELARRQKIANSKNPKRTEAMLNHWARFNKEGRVRNPKRSKAQIEADRAAEAARKASEPPKAGPRKKKMDSPGYGGPRIEQGIAPAPAPIQPAAPPTLAPGHPPHPQLAPLPAPRPSLNPYPPIDTRGVPFPGPHTLFQQPAPQPYRTPYPEFYSSPYGPPQLPHPAHPRPA